MEIETTVSKLIIEMTPTVVNSWQYSCNCENEFFRLFLVIPGDNTKNSAMTEAKTRFYFIVDPITTHLNFFLLRTFFY